MAEKSSNAVQQHGAGQQQPHNQWMWGTNSQYGMYNGYPVSGYNNQQAQAYAQYYQQYYQMNYQQQQASSATSSTQSPISNNAPPGFSNATIPKPNSLTNNDLPPLPPGPPPPSSQSPGSLLQTPIKFNINKRTGLGFNNQQSPNKKKRKRNNKQNFFNQQNKFPPLPPPQVEPPKPAPPPEVMPPLPPLPPLPQTNPPNPPLPTPSPKQRPKYNSLIFNPTGDWPQELKDYVNRCYGKCKTDLDKDQVEIVLTGKITAATASGELYVKDWSKEPLPSIHSERMNIMVQPVPGQLALFQNNTTPVNKSLGRPGKKTGLSAAMGARLGARASTLRGRSRSSSRSPPSRNSYKNKSRSTSRSPHRKRSSHR